MLIFSPACDDKDKDDDGWVVCADCTIGSWTGTFAGTATYFNGSNLISTEGVEMTIRFEETGTDYLSAYIVAPNYYSATLSGELNTPYAISFAGSSASLTATLYQKEGSLRIAGSSKKFHYKVDSLVIDESITFEALKTDQ